MAAHFDIGLRMYQRYENGEVVPEDYKMRKLVQRIELLESLDKLPPLLSSDSPKKQNSITDNYVTSDIEELRSLLIEKDKEIRLLELRLETAQLTINLLAEKAGVPLATTAKQHI